MWLLLLLTQGQPWKSYQSNSDHYIDTKCIDLYNYPEYWCWYTLVFEEIKLTFKSIITWDMFQHDDRVGCWNALMIALSSWYCFSYWISMFQFTASYIDFICRNLYKVYTRDCFFTEFEHFILLWVYG